MPDISDDEEFNVDLPPGFGGEPINDSCNDDNEHKCVKLGSQLRKG